MWIYQKTLQHPVNLKNADLKMAKYLITQFGGPNGELDAAIRYLSQRFTMPTGKSKALLTDIGTEELAHVELISTMVYQLTSNATVEELKAAGLGGTYAQNGYGIFPTDAAGVPFSVSPIAIMGNPITDLHEDMAAEQKALATYYHLINLTDDVDIIEVLKFLGEREIVHYQRFGEALMDAYDELESKKLF